MKNKNGITLIVLVITIVVLLILAGVIVYLSIINNGILSKATASVSSTKEAIAKEEIEEAWVACESEYWTKYSSNSSIRRSEIFTKENLNKFLSEKGFIQDFNYNENGKSYLTYSIKDSVDVYKFSIDNYGKVSLRNKTFTLVNFEDDYNYNNKPILSIGNEIDLESIEINDTKLITKYFNGNEIEIVPLDIIKNKYNCDLIDCGKIFGYDKNIPGVIIDYNNNVVKDFSKCDFEGYYYVIAIFSDEEFDNLINGNYIIDYGFWVGDWFNKPRGYISDLLGYNGLTIVPYWCNIVDKSTGTHENIYDVGYLDEEFKNAIELFEKIKTSNNVSTSVEKVDNNIESITYETDKYVATLSYTIGYEDCPIFYTSWENGKGTYNYYLLSTPIYDIGTIAPNSIRNKSTKDYVDYGNVLEELEETENPEDVYNRYEFYQEERFHILKEGKKISLE